MGRVWSQQFGDTSKFSISISFDNDPDEGRSATLPESSSWGALQIWVNGVNLCAHVEDGQQLDSTNWYLLPLLEWLVGNWEPIFHEERLYSSASDAAQSANNHLQKFQLEEDFEFDWRSRHGLFSARSGGITPNIYFRRFRSLIEVSWHPRTAPGLPEDLKFFATTGVARFEPDTVVKPLFEVLSSAASYLQETSPCETFSELKKSIAKLSTPREKGAQRLAWLAGLGDSWERMLANWKSLASAVRPKRDKAAAAYELLFQNNYSNSLVAYGSMQAALMFGSANPRLDKNDILLLADYILQSYAPNSESAELINLREAVGQAPELGKTAPWSQGYELAELVINSIGTQTDVSLVGLLKDLDILIHEMQASDPMLRAVAIAGPEHKPTILINTQSSYDPQYSAARNFSLAHELCHILFDRDRGQRLALTSGPWAPLELEKRANAFAAYFLAPPTDIRKAIAETTCAAGTIQWVQDVRGRLKHPLAKKTLIHHCFNLDFIDFSTKEFLIDQLS